MTANEKKDIYKLLKKTADWISGYETEDYGSTLDFQDDEEISLPVNETQSETLEIKANTEEKTEIKAERTNQERLNALAEKISSCKNCVLCEKRTNVVPGEGVENPCVMVIGEGPGEDEDKTGRPFVGKAGQLLDKMLSAIQLDRNKNCYIANIVKCRPPMNRAPMKDEADSCSGYLQAQIHILKPKMILALGRTAVQNLLNTEQGINSLRGKILDYKGIPLLATYHPSALLRDESLKRPAWEDLKTFRAKLKEISPDYDKD